MPLINCKIHLELNWIEEWTLSNTGDAATFKIINAKLHVTIVTLSTTDNVNLTKELSDGFKRSVYWNSYHPIPARVTEKRKNIYKLINASFQGVKRLFVLDYFIAPDDAKNEAGLKKQ